MIETVCITHVNVNMSCIWNYKHRKRKYIKTKYEVVFKNEKMYMSEEKWFSSEVHKASTLV